MDFKNFSRSIKIRIALLFLTTFSESSVMPFVIIFFVEQIGTTITTILTVVIGLASIVGALIGGKLADIYGRKKFILIGELFTAIGFFLVAFSNSDGKSFILGSLIGFLLIYFFSSFSQPAYSAFIIDETNEENRKPVYSFMMWSSYLALALGSVTGGLLFFTYKVELFIFVGLSSILSFLCVAIWIPDSFSKLTVPLQRDNQKTTGNVYLNMIKSPVFLTLAFITFVFALMDNQLGYYLSLRYVDLFNEQGYQILGFLRTENTLIFIFFTLWLTQKLKKFNELNTAIIGAFLFFIGYVALSFFDQPIYLYVAMAIVTIGEIVLLPSLQTIKANIIPDAERGTYSSIFGIVSTVGGLCASFFILFIDILSSTGITVLYCTISIISLAILLNYKRFEKEQ